VSFSERVPSTGWVSLTHSGEEIAEAWFMPEGEGLTGVFLVPRTRLDRADLSPHVTIETLLQAAAISQDEVESWRLGDVSDSGAGGANLELGFPLPPPLPDESHLTVYVQLKPPVRTAVNSERGEQEIPLETWQALDVLWKTILGLEASIDACRLNMEGLRAEMDSAYKTALTVDDKLNALQADVAQWNKAKGRVHYTLPKVREFIHRATWALAVPERKRLEEIIKNHVEPRNPLPDVARVREQLEHLQKDRQVLFAQGNAVSQESRGTLAEIQRALSTLQRNAADRARQKRSAGREKGKYF
jgi:hypothetical protein